MSSEPIRVLVVEDSPTASELLVHILESDPRIRVAGVAANGLEAVQFVAREHPDLITMDIHMPVMDGLEATRRIMASDPTPIVIISASWNPEEVDMAFRAMEAGAVSALEKPCSVTDAAFAERARRIVRTVRAMAEVRVVRRRPARGQRVPLEVPVPVREIPLAVVAVGASTGGPPVLRLLLSELGPGFPLPVLIVQHIASGFVSGFAAWLSSTTGYRVRVPEHGEAIDPGTVYLAPDGAHMGLGDHRHIALSDSPPRHGLRPSISHLFASLAACLGPAAAGVLLTGMGRDGADALLELRKAGGLTVAQDEESSLIFGMPGEAVRLGAADHVLPPQGIARILTTTVARQRARGGAS